MSSSRSTFTAALAPNFARNRNRISASNKSKVEPLPRLYEDQKKRFNEKLFLTTEEVAKQAVEVVTKINVYQEASNLDKDYEKKLLFSEALMYQGKNNCDYTYQDIIAQRQQKVEIGQCPYKFSCEPNDKRGKNWFLDTETTGNVVCAESDDFVLILNNQPPYPECYKNEYIPGIKNPSGGMSFAHLLVVPKKPTYNIASLDKNYVETIEKMKNEFQIFITGLKVDNFKTGTFNKSCGYEASQVRVKICLEIKRIIITTILSELYDDIKPPYSEIINKYLMSETISEVIERIPNKSLSAQISADKQNTISENIFKISNQFEFDSANFKNISPVHSFFFHLHPNHSQNQLHMHCIQNNLRTSGFLKHAEKNVPFDVAIEALKKIDPKSPTQSGGRVTKHIVRTADKAVIGCKNRVVYVGPRGGKYVKVKGEFVSVKKLKTKSNKTN